MTLRTSTEASVQEALAGLRPPDFSRPVLTQSALPGEEHPGPATNPDHQVWESRLAAIPESSFAAISATSFRTCSASPNTLNDVMSAALTSREPIMMSCAWVRCKLLQMPVADYAALLNLGEKTVRSLEKTPSSHKAKRELQTYTTLANAWGSLAEEFEISDPTLAKSLRDARQLLLDNLPRVDTRSSFGVLHRWRYEVGTHAFESVSQLSYNNLWARQDQGLYIDFHRLLCIGQDLGLIPKSVPAKEILENPTFKTLQDAWLKDCDTLGRPRSIARLHILLAIADITLLGDTLHLHEEIQLSSRHSERVAKFAPVSWDEISPVVNFLRSKEIMSPESDLERELCEQFSTDAQIHSQSFEARLRELAERQNIDNGMLADLFGLRSHEREKAALPVYRAIQYGEYDRSVPPGALALLLASSNEEAGNLLELKRKQIAESLSRQGKRISHLSVERQLWKLSYSDLPHAKETIQAIEWGKNTAADEPAMASEVLQIGLQRATDVLLRWHRMHDWSSVKSAVSSLLYRTPQNALESELGTSAKRLKSIAIGGEVPPLETTQRLLSRRLQSIPAHIERDWFDSYAKFQAGVNQTDLERLISTYIASRNETIGSFFESRNLSRQTCARILAAASNSGTLSCEDLETLRCALGIDQSAPFYRLISLVNSTGTVATALPFFASELVSVNDLATIQEIEALKGAYSADRKERERFRKGEVSLGELLDIRQGNGGPHKKIKEEAAAMRCLHNLPGLTAREVASINLNRGTDHAPCMNVIQRLLDRADDRGLSRPEIAFALQKVVKVSRQSLQQTSRALSIPLASPLTPTGVLAYLVSSDEAELATWLNECRSQAKAELVAAGLKASQLQIEMRIWGIRNDDIKMERHALGAILWHSSADKASAEPLLAQIKEIGESKAANALERLIVSQRSALTPDLCQVLLERHPGGSNGLSVAAHLPLGAPARYAEGELVPTQEQLEAMARACDLALTAQHRIGHHFSIAEQIAATSRLPLERCMNHLAYMTPKGEFASAGKHSALRKAHTDLLRITGLITRENMALLCDPSRNEDAYWRLCRGILRALGHDESSPLYDYALCLYLYRDTKVGLAHWGKGKAGASVTFPGLEPLRSFCSEMSRGPSITGKEISVGELLRAKKAGATLPTSNADIELMLNVVKTFPGARLADFLEDSAETHYSRIFAAMHLDNDAAEGAVPALPVPSEGHRIGRISREEEERDVVSDRNFAIAAAEAQRAEQDLIQRFTQALGETHRNCPDQARIQQWADILANLVRDPEISGLPRQFSSLRISVGEAPSRGLSFEVAFVRKATELLNRIRQRKKDSEGGDSGPKVFSIRY